MIKKKKKRANSFESCYIGQKAKASKSLHQINSGYIELSNKQITYRLTRLKFY